MHGRRFNRTAILANRGSLQLFVQAAILLSLSITAAQGQRSGQTSIRDTVRAIERKEMDRLLLLKPLTETKDNPARRAILKQISEDFRDMQGLNNKMMAQAWAREELDYRYISDMVSQIRGKAARLKFNLSLPEAEEKKPTLGEISSAREFRSGLLLLDRQIMKFATNPLFQKPNVVDVDLANQASRDLNAVVEMSGKLKGIASRLGKAKTSQ